MQYLNNQIRTGVIYLKTEIKPLEEKKTTIIITHNIEEAIALADKVVVLSKRPSVVKKIFDINLTGKSSPINNRHCPEFNDYYQSIWQELDHEI